MDPKNSARDWYNHSLSDGGPIYTETNPDHWIVEPWNAISSLMIVIPAIIWLFKIRGQFKDYRFLIFAIPLMVLGGTGSTLFHAFRVSQFFLFMDVLPTAILTLSLSIYFWVKVFKRWWYVFFVIIISFAFRFLLFGKLPSHAAINISYAITGVITGLPLLFLLLTHGFTRSFMFSAVFLLLAWHLHSENLMPIP